MLKVVDQLQSPEKPTMVKRLNFTPEILAVKTILPKVTLLSVLFIVHHIHVLFFFHFGLHEFLVLIHCKIFIVLLFIFYVPFFCFILVFLN